MKLSLAFYIFPSILVLFNLTLKAQDASTLSVNLHTNKGGISDNVSIVLKTTKDTVKHQGIPLDLDLHLVKEICFNRQQKSLEQYQDGLITKREFDDTQKLTRDTAILSDFRYKHTVYVLVGFNTAGKKVVIFDQNQNNDFSDEHVFEFDTTFFSLPIAAQNKIKANLPEVELSYEFFDGHQLVKKTRTLKFDPYRLLRHYTRGKTDNDRMLELRMITTEYLEGSFTLDGRDYKTMVISQIPSSATFFNPFIRIIVAPKLGVYPMTEMLGRNDTLLLDDHVLVVHGPSMFGDSMQITDLGKQFKPYGFRKGFYARDMTFLYMDGTSQRLSEILKGGKHVILDFWGTWCPPCIKQIPQIQDLYTRTTKTKNLTLISIAYDEDLNKVHKTVEQFNMAWPNAFDDSLLKNNASSPAKQLNVTGFPALFMIQPDGKIIATTLQEINQWIEEKGGN